MGFGACKSGGSMECGRGGGGGLEARRARGEEEKKYGTDDGEEAQMTMALAI